MIINIQFLRAVASLLIVCSHIILFGNDKYSLNLPNLNFIAGYFTIGIDIFFIISGFIMVYITYNKDISPLLFLKKRFVRIFPPLWMVCIILLPVFFLKPEWINSSDNIPTSLLHSFFLIPHEGTPLIKVAWTLEFEMFFYIIFAITLKLSSTRQIVSITLFFLFSIICGLLFPVLINSAIIKLCTSPYLLEFICGMLLGYYFKKIKAPSLLITLITTVTTIISFVYLMMFQYGEINRVLHFLPFAFNICFLFILLEQQKIVMPLKISIFGGKISYNMYLLHILILTAIWRFLTFYKTNYLPNYIICLIILGTSIICAWVMEIIVKKMLHIISCKIPIYFNIISKKKH
jgi:peptidoglycan/LPS O-acetylase OafA/YrhL